MSRRKRLERMNDRLAGQAAKWQMAAIAARRQVQERDRRIAELEAIVATYQQNPVWVPSPGPWETGTMPLAESQEARCDRLIEALRTGDATCNVSTEDSGS
jgi:hypothetical protein